MNQPERNRRSALLACTVALSFASGTIALSQVPTIPSPPTTFVTPAQTTQLSAAAMTPTFVDLSQSSAMLLGRTPGGSLRFSSNGGTLPLKFTVHAQPAIYQNLFYLTGALDSAALTQALQARNSIVPKVATFTNSLAPSAVAGGRASPQYLALVFRGLAPNVPFPVAPIDIFLKIEDGAGHVVEKYVAVSLSESAGLPSIDNVDYQGRPPDEFPLVEDLGLLIAGGASPMKYFLISYRNFSLSERGSRVECRYPSGLIYACKLRPDATIVGRAGLWVPDLGEGDNVTLRLVNDFGRSAPSPITIVNNPEIQVIETESFESMGVAVGETRTSRPALVGPFLANAKGHCNKAYFVWRDVSNASNVVTNQILDAAPRSVDLKSEPQQGSVVSASNLPQWKFDVLGATRVSFDVTYKVKSYVGKCADAVLAN